MEGDQATVRTKLLDQENREVAIDYRMLRRAPVRAADVAVYLDSPLTRG